MPATYFYTAPTGVNVATTSTEVAAEAAARRYLVLTNDSDTVIYLGVGSAAVLNSGLRVEATGGKVVFGNELFGDDVALRLPLTVQAVNGIHGGVGNKQMLVQEVV